GYNFRTSITIPVCLAATPDFPCARSQVWYRPHSRKLVDFPIQHGYFPSDRTIGAVATLHPERCTSDWSPSGTCVLSAQLAYPCAAVAAGIQSGCRLSFMVGRRWNVSLSSFSSFLTARRGFYRCLDFRTRTSSVYTFGRWSSADYRG